MITGIQIVCLLWNVFQCSKMYLQIRTGVKVGRGKYITIVCFLSKEAAKENSLDIENEKKIKI